MGKRNKRLLVRSATFLYVLLLILSAVPPIAPLITWLMPAPLLYMWLQGARSSVFMLSFTTLILALFGGSLAYLTIPILLSLLIAMIIGEATICGDVPVTPLALGTLALLVVSILIMGIAYANGISVPTELGQQIQGFIVHDPILQETLSNSELNAMAATYKQAILDTLPGILVISCFLIVFLNFTIVRLAIRRNDRSRLQYGGLSTWKLPKGFAVLSFVVLGVSFLPWINANHGLQVILSNLVLISSFFLALQGLSLIWRALSRYDKGKWFMLFILVLCLIRFIWTFYALLGFYDILYKRKSDAKR
jgi:uncharacterized protein YybS (DUF2232 family)